MPCVQFGCILPRIEAAAVVDLRYNLADLPFQFELEQDFFWHVSYRLLSAAQ